MTPFIQDYSAAWLKRLFHVILPPRCPACDALVSEQGGLCASCFKDMQFIEKPICDKTGRPLAYDLGEEIVSAEAIASPPLYGKMRSATYYNGTARRLILALKFQDRLDLAPTLARHMTRAGHDLLKDADLIIPVPLHRRRLFTRRFNQAAELTKEISKLTGIPMLHDGFKRIKQTQQQSQLNAYERLKNVEGAFRLRPQSSHKVRGKHVVLVDDVVTTGATANACIRALLREKAANIDVLCFSRVVDDERMTI